MAQDLTKGKNGTPTLEHKLSSGPHIRLRHAEKMKPLNEWTGPELETADRAYFDALRQGERQDIAFLLSKLAMHFWQAERPQEQWEAIVGDYLTMLPYPLDIVDAGCQEWHKVGKPFFPKIVELRELMQPLLESRNRNHGYLREEIERRSEKPRPLPTEADKAEVAEMLAEAKRNLSA